MSFNRIFLSVLAWTLIIPSGPAAAKRCSDAGMPANCVEVTPGQNGPGYEYNASHRSYFFRNLSNANHYFLLMGNIDCDKTCSVFGFDTGNPSGDYQTTFDLNGYTVRQSAAAYASLPNNGFEDWQDDTHPLSWTVVSGTVQRRSTQDWMPMSGDWVLYAPGPAVLESSLVSLPGPRAYNGYVTLGRADEAANFTLEVVREDGLAVCSVTRAGFHRGQSFSCRFDPSGPGRYKLRLIAGGQGYFDRSGLVPINDYGVAVLTSWDLDPGNNSQNAIVQNLPGANIPASGDWNNPSHFNYLEVMNGRIEAGHENLFSHGILIHGPTRLKAHHLTVVGQGIKSHAIEAGGEIHHNTLQVDMPWYFARESSNEENVIFYGGKFYNNTAIGGQGVLRLQNATAPEVYGNTLRNNAQATNHYAIINDRSSGVIVHDNLFDPIQGSGILTYDGHGYRIYNNTFRVTAAPCNVEYVNEDYSTNGVRMNDYGAKTNYDNWVYNNIFTIDSAYRPTQWPNCMPIATGIFYSASGPGNRVFGNRFTVTRQVNNEHAPAFALYLGDAANNPADNILFRDNVIETNDQAVWVTCPYNPTSNMWLEHNTFTRRPNTFYTPDAPASALRFGYGSFTASGVHLVNNLYSGGFDEDAYYFTAADPAAAYDLTKQWYLHVQVLRPDGQPAEGATVTATPASGAAVSATTCTAGWALLRLTQYTENGDMTPAGQHHRVNAGPYQLQASYQEKSATRQGVTAGAEQTAVATLANGQISLQNGAPADPAAAACDGTVVPPNPTPTPTPGPDGPGNNSTNNKPVMADSGGCTARGNAGPLAAALICCQLLLRRPKRFLDNGMKGKK